MKDKDIGGKIGEKRQKQQQKSPTKQNKNLLLMMQLRPLPQALEAALS